jgi:hypothetical protein
MTDDTKKLDKIDKQIAALRTRRAKILRRIRYRKVVAARRRNQPAADAAYINQCEEILRAELQRLSGEVPDYLTLPLTTSGRRRHMLNHWLDELRQKTGKAVRVSFIKSSS